MQHSEVDIKRRITEHLRRLQELEIKSARMGIDSPPELLMEIEDIEKNIEDLRGQLAKPEYKEGATGVPLQGSPYPGLHAFTPRDEAFFFGREPEIEELVEDVRESDFLAVVGPSGSGKSSLVSAGLLPRLKRGAISGSATWLLPYMHGDGASGWAGLRITPAEVSDNPFSSLAVKLASLVGGIPREIADDLMKNPSKIVEFCSHALSSQPDQSKILLFIDQFEELFTLVRDINARQAFVTMLEHAASYYRIRTVITLRADFFHHCLEFNELTKLLRNHSFTLSVPDKHALYQMITGPAIRAGINYDPKLPKRIVEDTGQEPGSLALMAYTLDELFKVSKQTNEGGLTLSIYNQLEGVQGAIRRQAEQVFLNISPEAQQMLPHVFRELVTVTAEGMPTRKRAYSSLVEINEAATQLVDKLTSARLLVKGKRIEHEPIIEVAHEALFNSWPRLKQWIDETKHDLYLLRQVNRAASEWVKVKRDPAYLWPHGRLVPVYEMIQKLQPELSRDMKDFIRPESERILEELDKTETDHRRRMAIGDRLYVIGDPRPGVRLRIGKQHLEVGGRQLMLGDPDEDAGLSEGCLPDIAWCEVKGTTPQNRIHIGSKSFEVKPFYIARYPVTNIQFRAFLDDEEGFKNPIWWEGLHLQQEETIEQIFELYNHPRSRVFWHQAVAFCRWLTAKLPHDGWPKGNIPIGKNWVIRLPTEWEWQQAATGGNPNNTFPWGPEWRDNCANTQESRLMRSIAVGMYPQGGSPVGALDMVGNIQEWCLNKFDPPDDVRIEGNENRVLRGACWVDPKEVAQCSTRRDSDTEIWPGDFGFRVCVAPQL